MRLEHPEPRRRYDSASPKFWLPPLLVAIPLAGVAQRLARFPEHRATRWLLTAVATALAVLALLLLRSPAVRQWISRPAVLMTIGVAAWLIVAAAVLRYAVP